MKFLFIFFCFMSINLHANEYRGDKFLIRINNSNQMMVEDETCTIEELSLKLYDYIKTNQNKNIDNYKARYVSYTIDQCEENISYFEKTLQVTDSLEINKIILNSELRKWNKRLVLLNFLKINEYRFIHDSYHILIKVKAKTSYEMYISVISEIKKTIIKLRNEKAQELFNMSYDKIISNHKSQLMFNYFKVLRTLIPERIIDAPVRS